MAIREEIEGRVKQARRDKDERTLNVIGMLKNKVLVELKSGSGAEDNDELWLSTIASYVKQLRKSIAEFEKAGERGKEALVEIEFEIAFCEQFLPKRLDEAATETIVRGLVATHGLADQGAKATGKLMGLLMKEHRETIDSEIAKSVVQRVLAGG
ncbi:MAG: GatB/YqeY domain-containing protein [Deltaproteobacteria bacterium]|nr:GatB/YqeY domain-containing protein [Nannocystaceae bacterium]